MVVESWKDDFSLPSNDEAVKASTLPRQSSRSIVIFAALFHFLKRSKEKESDERRKDVLKEQKLSEDF